MTFLDPWIEKNPEHGKVYAQIFRDYRDSGDYSLYEKYEETKDDEYKTAYYESKDNGISFLVIPPIE